MPLLAALILLTTCPGATSAAPSDGSKIVTKIGIEGVYYLRASGPTLEAAPVEDDAPIVLRIASITPDAASSVAKSGGKASIYELRYIGTKAGQHDLRKSLLRIDGEPIKAMEPMMVTVESTLPSKHDGELEDRALSRVAMPWPYRATLAVVGLLWITGLVGYILLRRLRRPVLHEEMPLAEPVTRGDELCQLVELAVAGRLSTEEQARLERMLIAFWRVRLDLENCPIDEALARMRCHGRTAVLLEQLDVWLHRRPGGQPSNVQEILRPYRNHVPATNVQVLQWKVQEAAP
jgi:hypothetical protein